MTWVDTSIELGLRERMVSEAYYLDYPELSINLGTTALCSKESMNVPIPLTFISRTRTILIEFKVTASYIGLSRAVMIPGLESAPESDFGSFWTSDYDDSGSGSFS